MSFIINPFVVGAPGGGGGGVFVAGAALDLGADIGLGLSDNDPVALWADQSGNANDASQGTAANKPTFKATDGPGGLPAISWDGGDFLDLSSALPRANYTIFAVIKPTVGGNKTVISGPGGGLQYRYNGGGPMQLLMANTAIIGASTTSISDANFQQVNVRWDGTTATFRYGSAADGSTANAMSLTADITRIGAHGGGGENFIGLISMVLVYTSVLSLADVQTNEAAILSRWGV